MRGDPEEEAIKLYNRVRRGGRWPENFWERLKTLGPAQIIDIEGDEGEKIQIWIE